MCDTVLVFVHWPLAFATAHSERSRDVSGSQIYKGKKGFVELSYETTFIGWTLKPQTLKVTMTNVITCTPSPSSPSSPSAIISKISTYSAAMDTKLLPAINHEPWTSKKVKGKR